MKGISFMITKKFFLVFILLSQFSLITKSQQATALDFDGVDDYVDLGASSNLKPTSGLTVEMWVYKANWPSSPGESFISNTQLSGYAIFIQGSNLAGEILRNGTYGIVTTPLSGISSGWHHIALTYDGRYTNLYLDGQLMSTDDAGATYPITYIANNTFLGAEGYFGATPEAGGYMFGKLDEVRIYGYAKTYCYVEYERNMSNTLLGTLATYHFDTGTASGNNTGLTTLGDYSGNGNNGTLIGMALTGSNSNWVAPGAIPSNYYYPFTYTQTPTLPCTGATATIALGGTATYTWNGSFVGSTHTVTIPASLSTAMTLPNSGCTFTYNWSPNTGVPTVYISASSNVICNGETTTLTACCADTYTWSNASNNTSIAITPSGNTNRSVTGTSTLSGCTASAVVNITVNPLPTVAIVPSSTVACSVDNVTLTASGALTYVWSNGSTTLSTANPFITSPNSNYTRTVTGTDGNGCTDQAVQTISVNPSPTVVIVPSSTTICSGESVTLTASGANTYTWVGGPTNAVYVVSPTVTTSYTVTGRTTATGCTDVAVITISVNTSPNVTITPSSATICSGNSVTLTASGASTYTWNGGSNSVSITPSPTATVTRTVTGTAANGCTNVATQVITVNTTPTVGISTTSTVLCSGQTATLTASGANTYVWVSGPATAVNAVSPVVTTVYTVTGTSAVGGCTDTAVQSISVNASPNVTITPSSTVICSVDVVTLTTSGASTYTWSNSLGNNTTVTLSPNSTVSRSVIGTAVNGCTTQAVQSISVNTSPVVTTTSSGSPICSGQSATLTANGADTYTWNGVATGSAYVVSPSSTTNYTVIGTTTASGCTDQATRNIAVITSPTVTIVPSSTVICSVDVVTLTAGGASTYTWSNSLGNNTTVTLSPNSTVSRNVIGTAANGCTNQAVQSISVNTTPTITVVPSSTVICSGKSATLTASGANTYTWTSGPITAANVVSPSSTTIYTVTGETTASGCTNMATISLSVNASPTVTIVPSSTVICSVDVVTLTAGGASTYTWSNSLGNNTTVTLSPNSTVSRTVIATAVNSCTNQAVQSISVNTSPTVTVVPSSTVICSGESATLTASGANTYTWTSGSLTAASVVSPSSTTIYTVTGETTASGCTDKAIISLSVNATPTVTILPSSSVTCSSENVTLTANGAISYTWSNGGFNNTSIVLNLSSNYTRTVTGIAANGCTNQAVQSISVNTSPVMTVSASNTVICSGASVTLTASGANTYSWSGGPSGTTYTVSPSTTTNYSVTGTNGSGGCTHVVVQTVSVNITPTVTIAPSTTVICTGKVATLTASGANLHSWSGGPYTSSYTVSPMSNTIYTVTGINGAGGCSNTAVQSISVNASPTLAIAASTTVMCLGNSTTLTASGANSYTWTGGPSTTTYVVSPLTTTSYTVVGTAGTCTNSAVETISINALPSLTITPSNTAICAGNMATLTASGANAYVWTSGPSTSVYTINPSSTSSYTVTGTNTLSGCVNTATQSMVVNPIPVLTITPSSTVFCLGNTGTLTASGANTYVWTGGPSTPAYTINPSSNASYTVTGTNSAGGCTNTAVQSVSVNPVPVVTISGTTVICSGQTTTLTGSGATNYTWTNGPSLAANLVTPSTTTNYTLTGETNGCSNTSTISVTVNSNPTITVNSGTICTGGSFTAVANGANSYTWNTGSNSSSVIVSPSTSTVYTVVGTNTNNCSNSKTSTVTVTNGVTVNIVASASTLCAGESATLTVSGANSYTWSNASNSSSIVVSPVSSTTYSVLGSSGTNCSNTANQAIVVSPSPIISVIGPTFVCGNTQQLLIAFGASSFSWTNGPNTASLLVTPTVTTIYTVQGTNAANCIGSGTFQLNTPLVVTPSLCLVTVDSASINNEIYWEKSLYPQADTFIVLRNTSGNTYSPIARIPKSGLGSYVDTNRAIGLFNGNPNITSYKYKLQYRDSCGNLSAMSAYHESIFIQDNQTGNFTWNQYFIEGFGPVTSVSYILWRQNVLTAVTTSVGASGGTALTDPLYPIISAYGNVKWYVSMSGFDCDPSQRLSSPTAATITTTKSNNSNEKQFPLVTTGIEYNKFAVNYMKIYPNPVENMLTLDFGSIGVNVQLEVKDVAGRLVKTDELIGNKFYLSTRDFNNGIYFLTLYDKDVLIKTEKIIVQH